jgi:hypothetical protein
LDEDSSKSHNKSPEKLHFNQSGISHFILEFTFSTSSFFSSSGNGFEIFSSAKVFSSFFSSSTSGSSIFCPIKSSHKTSFKSSPKIPTSLLHQEEPVFCEIKSVKLTFLSLFVNL